MPTSSPSSLSPKSLAAFEERILETRQAKQAIAKKQKPISPTKKLTGKEEEILHGYFRFYFLDNFFRFARSQDYSRPMIMPKLERALREFIKRKTDEWIQGFNDTTLEHKVTGINRLFINSLSNTRADNYSEAKELDLESSLRGIVGESRGELILLLAKAEGIIEDYYKTKRSGYLDNHGIDFVISRVDQSGQRFYAPVQIKLRGAFEDKYNNMIRIKTARGETIDQLVLRLKNDLKNGNWSHTFIKEELANRLGVKGTVKNLISDRAHSVYKDHNLNPEALRRTKKTRKQRNESTHNFKSSGINDFKSLASKQFSNLQISNLINIRASDQNPRIKEIQALQFKIDDNNFLTLSPTGANPLQLRLNGVDIINSPIQFDYQNQSGSFKSDKFSPTNVGGAPLMVSLGRIVGSKIQIPAADGGFETRDLTKYVAKPNTGYAALNSKPGSQTGSSGIENICHCSTLFNEFKLEDFSTNDEGEFKIRLALNFKDDIVKFLPELGPGKLSVTYSIIKDKSSGVFKLRADIKLESLDEQECVYAGALGAHLYLNCPEGSHLTIPATHNVLTNDFGEPTGPIKAVTDELNFTNGKSLDKAPAFDHTLTNLFFDRFGWTKSRLKLADGDQIELSQTMEAPFLQVFNNAGKPNSKGEHYLCLEPLAGAPDSLNQTANRHRHFNPVIVTPRNPYKLAYQLECHRPATAPS